MAGKEVWSSEKNTTKLKEGGEKRGRDNEGGIERVELSSGVNLSQSDQSVRRTNSLQRTGYTGCSHKVRMLLHC